MVVSAAESAAFPSARMSRLARAEDLIARVEAIRDRIRTERATIGDLDALEALDAALAAETRAAEYAGVRGAR